MSLEEPLIRSRFTPFLGVLKVCDVRWKSPKMPTSVPRHSCRVGGRGRKRFTTGHNLDQFVWGVWLSLILVWVRNIPSVVDD